MPVHDDLPTGKGSWIVTSPGEGGVLDGGGEGFSGDTMFREDAVRMGRSGGMSEIITLVKDTSLARTIAIIEVIRVGEDYITSSGLFWPLFYTGAFYLVFCGILTILFGQIEKKLSYFNS